MIYQRKTITKTATTTLTVAEMGDIVCNSSNAQTYTLPTVSVGLWHRLTNIGTGTVTVNKPDASAIATLTQDGQVFIINEGSSWHASGILSIHTAADTTSLINNVTAGGTTNQIDDYSDLTVYATDASAIRNNIYQLGRKVKEIEDALRASGLYK